MFFNLFWIWHPQIHPNFSSVPFKVAIIRVVYRQIKFVKNLIWQCVKTLVPLVNIKIAGKWMFIPLKMVLIGIDP